MATEKLFWYYPFLETNILQDVLNSEVDRKISKLINWLSHEETITAIVPRRPNFKKLSFSSGGNF